MNLIAREIDFESPEYWQAVELREAVLRRPLGLHLPHEQLEAELHQFHIACFQEEILLGGLILMPTGKYNLHMRQVAVAPASQCKGVGRALVKFAEQIARQHSYREIDLHARVTAIPFYEKVGYKCTGKEFDEVTLPHKRMYKNLLR